MTEPNDDPRAASVWRLHDFSRGRGVEMGPLFAPQFDRHQADVKYLDVVSTDELRSYYADDPRVDEDDIVDVDYALNQDGVVRSISESVGADGPFDWCFASHVVEHVPDLIGWLADVAEVVRPGGFLVLVVPDKRFTFDLHRPPTTVGAMIQANRDHDAIPSIRAVYDHFHSALTVDSARLWSGRETPHPPRIYDEHEAEAYIARHGVSHVDPHVWIFTPDLFLLQINELRRRGLVSWYVDRFETTPTDRLEFYARLRRLEPDQSSPLDDEVLPTDDRPHWLVEAAVSAAREAELKTRIEHLTERLQRQRRRARRLRQRLDTIEASRRWRVAGALARPVALLRRL